MKQFIKLTGVLSALFLVMVYISGCKKQNIRESTTTDVNIVDYMREYPEKFSEFLKILDRTNISPYLNAYGTYTVFAPTNDAVKLYLQQINKTSTDELDTVALRDLVRIHLIQDTVSTSSFTDGKLSTPTMYGQYLITGVTDAGITTVNRQALITQSNILTGNGYIHVIDHVLQAAKLTLAKMIEQNTKFSIFTQALKATGFYDTLNIANNPDPTRRWYTLLAESDSVMRVSGINSYNDLVKKYNNTGNPKNPNDSLYLYVSYHILPGIKYVADIISAPSHTSLAPLNVVSANLIDQKVLLNQATFNGAVEPGVQINRANSDNSATNGVMHVLLGDIYLKVRTPVPVYFDVADQPELRKMTSIFRKDGKSVTLTLGQLADVTWQQGTINYFAEASTATNQYYWNDGLSFTLRAVATTNNFIEFTTPLIVQGRYKVWICYRRGGHGVYTQTSFDGLPLSRIIDLTQYYIGGTDAVAESQGFKKYTYNYSNPVADPPTTQVAQLAGIINVSTTDRHKIRLTCIKDAGTGANGVTLDMIQFIPVEMDQQWPRFGKDGSLKYTP